MSLLSSSDNWLTTLTRVHSLLQIFNFWAAVSAAFLVDRLGRRTLFLWSGIGMLVSFIIWTACSATFEIDGSKGAGIVVVAFVFIYFFHYDICYTPLLFGYTTEILPYSLRAKGLTVELFSIYGSLIILAFVNPIALNDIGWHYYILFCCLLGVILTFTYFYFPETKGYSLEEIAEVFDGPAAGRKVSVDMRELSISENRKEEGTTEHVDIGTKA